MVESIKTDIAMHTSICRNDLTNYEDCGMWSKFESHEFSHVFYVTNEQLYYMSDELETTWSKVADEIKDTDKGRVYCFA